MRRQGETFGDVFSDLFKKLKEDVGAGREESAPQPPRNGMAGVRPLKSAEPSMLADKRKSASQRTASPKRGKRNKAKARLQPPEVDLTVFRSASRAPGKVTAATSKMGLTDMSADMTKLSIRAARADALPIRLLAPASENGLVTAVLGLDFGTAFTKAVVRLEHRHYVVDWSDAVDLKHGRLLPTAFSEHATEGIALGRKLGQGWQLHDGIKMRLLATSPEPDRDAQLDAVLFMAAALRYAQAWLCSRYLREPGDFRWRLHVGLPTESWDHASTAVLFRRLAAAGRAAACFPGPLNRDVASQALDAASSDAGMVYVLPEFVCQLFSYLSSAQRQTDMHALLDVGAGTVDMAFFNVHEHEGMDVLPILAAAVKPLGTHYLLAALAGKAGEHMEWKDSQVDENDQQVAERLGEDPADVHKRRIVYLSALAQVVNDARQEARVTYPTSRAWNAAPRHQLQRPDHLPVELFLCGGGARVHSIAEHVRSLARETRERCGLDLQVTPLPLPKELVGDLDADQYDRISVAYGLSQLPGVVGEVIKRSDLAPYEPIHRQPIDDRDATR